MRHSLIESWKSVLRLLRFLFWYGVAVAAIIYLLPMAAALVEDRYEAMSSALRFFSVLGFLAVVGAWQIISWRVRTKAERPACLKTSADES